MIGELSLSVALLAAAGAILAAVIDSRIARRLIGLCALLVVVASGALLNAFINSDFGLVYVAGYSERALPVGYKLAAFWAGKEGSMLLWALILALCSAAAAWQVRKDAPRQQAVTLATLAAVNAFFVAVMLFAPDSNPFKTQPIPADGFGLNPLLQNPAMIAHPPLLFVGYAGFTVPFAMLFGALVAGRTDRQWVNPMRRWLLFSWLFLSAGILLGAQWAYVELGWGGYWAWDPVENASLLPWLTGTAAIHSIGIQFQRGMFKRWNASLIGATFLLCIFGTYLTRSGVVQSVHAFGDSLTASLFLAFLALAAVATVALIAWRWKALEPENELTRLVGKEGAFLAANALLVLMTLVTLVGTILPVLTGPFVAEPISVGPEFYNQAVVPLGLGVIALMSVGPLLSFGDKAADVLKRGLMLPGLIAAAAVSAAVVLGLRNPWAIGCLVLLVFTVVNVFVGLFKNARIRAKLNGENLVAATLGALDANHRRYGGQTVHLGMILIAVGIAGSSLFSEKQSFQMRPGETAQIAGYTVTFNGLDEIRRAHYTAVDATITLTDSAGRATTLHPQRRFYDKSEQPNAEVALTTSLKQDVYVTLAGWDDGGRLVAIEVIINPLVLWIWIGSIVLVFGAVACLLPPLLPKAAAQSAVAVSLPTGIGTCQTPALENQS